MKKINVKYVLYSILYYAYAVIILTGNDINQAIGRDALLFVLYPSKAGRVPTLIHVLPRKIPALNKSTRKGIAGGDNMSVSFGE